MILSASMSMHVGIFVVALNKQTIFVGSDAAIIVMVCKSLHLHASTEILITFGQEQSSASL
jgi:hypothetical protein